MAPVQPAENTATVRFQKRSLDRRLAEIRYHIGYLIFLTSQRLSPYPQWALLREECESLPLKIVRTFGLVWNASEHAREQRWYLTQESRTKPGRRVLEAALFVACTVAHMTTCTTVRLCRGINTLPAIPWILSRGSVDMASDVAKRRRSNPPAVSDPQPGDMDKPLCGQAA